MRSLDIRRVLDRSTRELGKGLAELECSLRLHLEAGFLRHGRVEAVCLWMSELRVRGRKH